MPTVKVCGVLGFLRMNLKSSSAWIGGGERESGRVVLNRRLRAAARPERTVRPAQFLRVIVAQRLPVGEKFRLDESRIASQSLALAAFKAIGDCVGGEHPRAQRFHDSLSRHRIERGGRIAD